MSFVFIEGSNHGPAPLTLSSGYTNRLLPPGDTLVLVANRDHAIEEQDKVIPITRGLGGEHAGIRYNEDGSLTLLRGGYFHIFRSGSQQATTRCPVCSSPSPSTAAQNTSRFSRHLAPPTVHSSRSALRTAQLLCGFVGFVLLVIAFNSETSVEGIKNTAKDFAINFASDILAVASILVAAEFIDKVRGGGGQLSPVPASDRPQTQPQDASDAAPNDPLATNWAAATRGKVENSSETQLPPPLHLRSQHDGINVPKSGDLNPSIYVHSGTSSNRNNDNTMPHSHAYYNGMHIFGGYSSSRNQQHLNAGTLLSSKNKNKSAIIGNLKDKGNFISSVDGESARVAEGESDRLLLSRGSDNVTRAGTVAKSAYERQRDADTECSGTMSCSPSLPHEHDDLRTLYTSPLTLAAGIE